jgi:hypothetical protein
VFLLFSRYVHVLLIRLTNEAQNELYRSLVHHPRIMPPRRSHNTGLPATHAGNFSESLLPRAIPSKVWTTASSSISVSTALLSPNRQRVPGHMISDSFTLSLLHVKAYKRSSMSEMRARRALNSRSCFTRICASR